MDLIEIILKFAKGVRLKITEKNIILVVLKSISERSSIVILSIGVRIASNIVLKVTYICAVSVPTNLFIFRLFITVDCNFHSVVEHRIAFVVVHDVKLDTVAFASILYSEIKPLCMTFSVYIILHKAVVLYI